MTSIGCLAYKSTIKVTQAARLRRAKSSIATAHVIDCRHPHRSGRGFGFRADQTHVSCRPLLTANVPGVPPSSGSLRKAPHHGSSQANRCVRQCEAFSASRDIPRDIPMAPGGAFSGLSSLRTLLTRRRRTMSLPPGTRKEVSPPEPRHRPRARDRDHVPRSGSPPRSPLSRTSPARALRNG